MDILVIHSLYIPYMHICFLDMFHVFSLVCFLIYGVKSGSGHDQSQSFGPILHVSGSKISFWRNPTSPLGWGGLGLRLFQSSNWEGLPFPLPPSLGCGSRGSRSVIGHLFGARFEPPFFHHLGPPQIVITSYFGSKAIPFWGPKRGPKQAPTSELAFSLIFLGFLIFSIPPQVPPV